MNKLTLFVFLIIMCRCTDNNGNKGIVGDTLSLENAISLKRTEYESLRKSILEDTALTTLLLSNVSLEDTEIIKFKKLMETPYDNRIEVSGYNAREIDSIFYALKITKNIMNRFDSLDKSLNELDTDSLHLKSETVSKRIEESIMELKQKEIK